MITKYAVIEIKSAKFVVLCKNKTKNKIKPDDYVCHHGRSPEQRTKEQCVDIPEVETDLITKHQVSGMLHAMLGSRPVSYIHGSLYSSSNVIDELANNSLIKVNNKFCYKINGIPNVFREITQSRKSHYDSNKPDLVTISESGEVFNGKLTWWDMKKRFMIKTHKKYGNMYDYIMNFLHSICKDESLFNNHNIIDFFKIITKDPEVKEKALAFFEDEDFGVKKGGLNFINMINGVKGTIGFEGSNKSNGNLAAKTITKGIKTKISLDATILVPVTNDVARTFVTSKRFATFGDDGVAIFRGIESYNEDDLIYEENFIKIYI